MTKTAQCVLFLGKMPRPRKRQREEEIKYLDTDLSFTIDATAEVPATGQLVLVPQGDDASERIGEFIEVCKIEIHGILSYSPGLGTAVGEIWLMLDRQPNGAAATAAQILETVDFLYKAMPNMSNRSRFVKLALIPVEMQSNAGVSGAYAVDTQRIDECWDVSIPIEFDGAAGAIPRTNNIFLFAGANTGADDQVAVLATCRVHFRD